MDDYVMGVTNLTTSNLIGRLQHARYGAIGKLFDVVQCYYKFYKWEVRILALNT